ncbi:MAG: hypothetical protein ACYTG5_01550 [Planctomycetota bacterium]
MSQSPLEQDDRLQVLKDLLLNLSREPLDLAEALRWEREQFMENCESARDLERLELRFLDRMANDPAYGQEYRERVELARRSFLEAEFERLRISEDAGALFELADLRAAFLKEGMQSEAISVQQVLELRIAAVGEVDAKLREEARERYASLATEEEDLSLEHKVSLLEEEQSVFEGLHRRTGDKEMGRLARRLGRAAADRRLAMRVESALTRRGAAILENLSLSLLVLVFFLLAIEASLPEGHPAITYLQIFDASICLFFIVEFLFKLLLAPARGSWFLRNALIDLLPAIPAAMWFLQPTGAEGTVWLRVLRFMRITWFARYVAALRPALRMFRLALFLIKGMDSLVRRFSPFLNRNFVFFEREVLPLAAAEVENERSILFQALRREHILLAGLPVKDGSAVLGERARSLMGRLREPPRDVSKAVVRKSTVESRDIPVEHAIEFLHRLHPEELGAWISRNDILSIDRLVRVINAPLVRSLPIIRRLRSKKLAGSEEERVVDFAKRLAMLFENWRERALFFADMHGIVTGPQVLDRIASTMVLATKRPAIRLLLFGLGFLLIQAILGAENAFGLWLGRFVGTPLMVVGSICLVLLGVGWWLKRLAGEASDAFKLTSEAHFIGLLELMKRRHQDRDLEFLGKRVFRWDLESWEAAGFLTDSVRTSRTGHRNEAVQATPELRDEIERVSLLYLHFLDGAILHESDIKTNQQLLANLSLENIRNGHLGFTRKDRKRLRSLSLADGSIFRGPYVWFRFITESVAVETAKLITDYNRHCLTIAQRQVAGSSERDAFAGWLRERRRQGTGRLGGMQAPGAGPLYTTTEFNALDFLTADQEREEHVARIFGRSVLRLVKQDRQRMIREIFGTKPLHELPASKRTVNVYTFYQSRLSSGRAVLMPLYAVMNFFKGIGAMIGKTVTIAREILDPERAALSAQRGRASFAVALRKIHRMKAPTLMEAIRLRVAFDPAYCGAPPGWSNKLPMDAVPEFEKDMDFLMLRQRDRQELRELATENRSRVEELHGMIHRHPEIATADDDASLRRRGERAVTIAYVIDRHNLRHLFRAERWFEATLPEMESFELSLPGCFMRRSFLAFCRGFTRHPVDRWLLAHQAERKISRRGRGNLKRAWHLDLYDVKATIRAWSQLDSGKRPSEEAVKRARQIYLTRDDISRELAALRTVQSLSVLDVRNYRRLVFELGAYAEDGEDPALAEALP